ncbi:MAG: RagB/SusD family nutrient uptake outer membrane protein [Pedobacter sp.]|uniref:RagB/SusD family nutrient uptake outer membrane protein n=1 Tax=Pedobacter sp. TaxID=1411316 RepID=UPI00356454E1
MKILKQYILGLVLTAGVLTLVSCKKEFLEIDPKGSIITSKTQDYELALNGTYISSAFTASIYMGDEVGVQNAYFSGATLRMQRLFKYEDRIYQSDEIPTEIDNTEGYVRRLYLYNKIINEIMDSEGGTLQQKNAIMAEAKAGRAICNFMFLSDFSKPYNEKTATTDLGIPSLTQADVTQNSFTRLSQKENYDFIIQDLTEAIPHLGPLVHRRKISKLAAQFYLARIFMTMHRFKDAENQINNAFSELSSANIGLRLYDYNEVLSATGQNNWLPFSPFGYSKKPLAANYTETIYDIQASSFQLGSHNTFVLSPKTALLYGSGDKRIDLFDPMNLFEEEILAKGMRRPIGFFVMIGPSLPDLYLMSAECKARDGNLGGAIEDLEKLRVNRLSEDAAKVPANIAADQQALVRFILDERIREFAFTGLRWLDMRRLSQDPIYSDHVNYVHEFFDADGNVVKKTEPFKKERFALKFGERMLRESQGLQENP